ncbi:hypothetical protein IRB23M11_22820 [Alkalibacterium sp. m-11]|uniref:Ion transporter n=1 Tax=Alkalibacterium indicireducens TaxID=398758 RepID=A0ABN1BDW8_9LACT
MTVLKKYYDPVIIILALFSVSMVVMDSLAVFDIGVSPFLEIDRLILLLFACDFFSRLLELEEKAVISERTFWT